MGGSAPRRDCRLPVETTSFVDRRNELAEGRELLARARLVTLTGPGGVGKTRLAVRIAARVERAFPDGVRFVHLCGLHDPTLVPLAVGDALGLHDHSARPALDALVEGLRERRVLLVLDNCEHLLTSCATLAAALLRGTTGVRVLATSRHRLGLTEEHLMEVRPLPVPDPDGDLSAADGYPALALFADRAAAVLPGFRLTAANRASVARLCRRLDGLPLAIELAAVRMRVLDVPQLLTRLDDRYRLLTTGGPTVAPRHQTLRAAVDWSHELCDDHERLTWSRLSVLPGAFDLEAAEAVCAGGGEREAREGRAVRDRGAADREGGESADGGEGAGRAQDVRGAACPAGGADADGGADGSGVTGMAGGAGVPGVAGGAGDGDVLEAVAGLVDKSILCRETGPDGGVRYRLLDTLRHYGLERLRERPGEEHTARVRHRDWVQRRAALAEQQWFGPGQPDIVARLRADQDHLRAALDFSLSTPGETLAGLRLAGTLWFHWHACGAPREGRYWLDRALEASPRPTPERARALWVAGLLAGCPEDLTRGRRRAEQARELARSLGNAAEEAHADYVVGVIRLFSDDLTGALDHFRAVVARGPVPGEHLSLVGLDRVELACALAFLGRADEAVEVCEQTRPLCAEHGERWVLSYVERILALAHGERGDWERAERHGRQALRLKHAVHDVVGMGLTLDLLARIAAARGAHERAGVLLGGADRAWADVDRDRWGSVCLNSGRRDSEERVVTAIGRAAFRTAYDHGAALPLADVVALELDDTRGRRGPRNATASEPGSGPAATPPGAGPDAGTGIGTGIGVGTGTGFETATGTGTWSGAGAFTGGEPRVGSRAGAGIGTGTGAASGAGHGSGSGSGQGSGFGSDGPGEHPGPGAYTPSALPSHRRAALRPRPRPVRPDAPPPRLSAPRAAPAASTGPGDVPVPGAGIRLTRREAQVAELVAEGLANQQIADRLVIARRTAEGHVERILSKLGFSNRSQIAAWVTAQR